MKDRSVARGERGFSLIELLVVITIIGILATTVTIKVIKYVGEAKVVRAKAEIAEMKKAIGIYQLKNGGRLPESIQDLRNPQKGEEEGLIDIGNDPWGNEYQYEKTGSRKYRIVCLGADNTVGGTSDDADIDSDHLNDDAAEDK